MKKTAVIIFSLYLFACMLLTCVFGYKDIGAQLITFVNKAPAYSATQKVDKLFGAVTQGMTDGFFADDFYINIFGSVQKMMSRDIVPGSGDTTVIKSKNGSLYFGNDTSCFKRDINDEGVEYCAEKIKDFYDYCSENNVSFVYALAPSKESLLDESNFPRIAGLKDYRPTAESLVKKLESENVPVADLGTVLLRETADDYESVFFKTDHHWTISSAFRGFQEICEVATELNVDIDPMYYDGDSYETSVLKEALLGSMGVRVGSVYAGKDDYELICPRFDTDFVVEYGNTFGLNIPVKREGSFRDAILNVDYHNTAYASYIASDRGEIHVDNRLIDNGPNIMLIKDSFGIPVSGWLSCCADQLWVIDLRYKQDWSMYEYIQQHDIDLVIVLYNSSQITPNNNMYRFDVVSLGN